MKLRLKPGYKHTPIKHLKTSELFFVIKGTVVGIINGKHRQFTKGEGAYLPPLTPHAFTAGRVTLEGYDPHPAIKGELTVAGGYNEQLHKIKKA